MAPFTSAFSIFSIFSGSQSPLASPPASLSAPQPSCAPSLPANLQPPPASSRMLDSAIFQFCAHHLSDTADEVFSASNLYTSRPFRAPGGNAPRIYVGMGLAADAVGSLRSYEMMPGEKDCGDVLQQILGSCFEGAEAMGGSLVDGAWYWSFRTQWDGVSEDPGRPAAGSRGRAVEL